VTRPVLSGIISTGTPQTTTRPISGLFADDVTWQRTGVLSDSLSLRRKTRRKRLLLDQQCPSLLIAQEVTNTQNSTSEALASVTSASTNLSAKNDEWIKNVVDKSGVEPYYHQDGIVIWNCDCRDILPYLPKVDLVLTDPPYGIDYKPTFSKWNGDRSTFTEIVGDDAPFDASILLSVDAVIVSWGANYYHDQLPVGGWFCWDKRCSDKLDSMIGNPCEFAWNNLGKQGVARILHGGVVNADSQHGNNDKRHHPTQKPVKLMSWCISFVPDAETILDPFMGSGTTLVAAKQLGKRAIGIEIEEEYCRIAVERLAQGNLFGGVA